MKKWDRLQLVYVGMDIHKEQHCAVVLDSFGDRLGTLAVANRPDAYPTFLAAVRGLAPDKQLIFGLENTSTWGRALAHYLWRRGRRCWTWRQSGQTASASSSTTQTRAMSRTRWRLRGP